MPNVDSSLLARNRTIESALLNAAERYYSQADLRWFFAYAHGKITQQINTNIDLFEAPNDLIRLNIHFAEAFIRAVDGQPHEYWQRAFDFCQSVQNASDNTIFLLGEAEFCGARMARVHISIDLSAALREVGCISSRDYGNMLIFVNRGSLAALTRLRGRILGSGEVLTQALFADFLDLEIKAWRNSVYEDICHVPVPNPDPGFASRIHN